MTIQEYAEHARQQDAVLAGQANTNAAGLQNGASYGQLGMQNANTWNRTGLQEAVSSGSIVISAGSSIPGLTLRSGGTFRIPLGSSASPQFFYSPYPTAKQRAKLLADRAFKLVKRCFRHEDTAAVTRSKLSAASIAAAAKLNGQTALYEEMSVRLVNATTSAKLAAAGFTIYIDTKAVRGFQARTMGDINLTPIENFGRPIPDAPAQKLRDARESKLFKSFTVLHAGAAMIKTTAQKIREKDPIVFGLVEQHPDRLYYICDWIDELCHLTLGELIASPDFAGSLQSVDVNEKDLAAEVAERESLLARTNTATWKTTEAAAKRIEQRKPWGKIWGGIV